MNSTTNLPPGRAWIPSGQRLRTGDLFVGADLPIGKYHELAGLTASSERLYHRALPDTLRSEEPATPERSGLWIVGLGCVALAVCIWVLFR